MIRSLGIVIALCFVSLVCFGQNQHNQATVLDTVLVNTEKVTKVEGCVSRKCAQNVIGNAVNSLNHYGRVFRWSDSLQDRPKLLQHIAFRLQSKVKQAKAELSVYAAPAIDSVSIDSAGLLYGPVSIAVPKGRKKLVLHELDEEISIPASGIVVVVHVPDVPNNVLQKTVRREDGSKYVLDLIYPVIWLDNDTDMSSTHQILELDGKVIQIGLDVAKYTIQIGWQAG